MKLLFIVLAAALFGVGTGYLGLALDHYNHSQFGTSYIHWRGEWLGLPGFPGALLAEWQTGYDWRADEEWLHRHSVAACNAAFWSCATFVVAAPFALRRFLRHLMPTRETIPPVRYDF
jgi:hypothetical protein